ncbi:MAG: DsbC family protein [Pseudomonadota bacterium]
MKRHKFALLLLLSPLFGICADETPEATIRKVLAPHINPAVKIESVTATPYAGLYEVHAGGEILYTDKTATYLLVGAHVIDIASSQDLTSRRMEEINKIKFSDLPFESAVKLVKGNGKRVMAIFEDPNCGYCKRFRQTTLKEVDNVTVYTFMYNILSDDSAVKSANIWCSPDRNKAWDDWMVDGKAAPQAPANCKSPNDKVSELGHKLNINGTPAIFFADGTRTPGVIDLKTLEARLAGPVTK